MSEVGNSTVNLADLAGWAPFEGASDHLPNDGEYKFKITEVATGISDGVQTKGAPLVVLSLECLDADAQGLCIRGHRVHLGGKDKSGKPMIRQLGELLFAIGYTQEQITAFAQYGIQAIEGLVMNLQLVGKELYSRVVTDWYNPDLPRSKVENFIVKEVYERHVASQTHRRPHKAKPPTVASAPTGFRPGQSATLPPLATGTIPTGATLPPPPAPTMKPVAAAPTLPAATAAASMPVPAPGNSAPVGVDPLRAFLGAQQPRA